MEPRAGQPPRVLDPACGAGRFLLAVYRRLAASKMPGIDPLELATHSIYGVDVDPLAVETARYALLLAALADMPTPDAARIAAARSALEQHVRWADALVEPADGLPMNAAPPLDWKSSMPEVFTGDDGGFDVVLGNPPYRRERQHKAAMDLLAQTSLGRRYRAPRMDLWYYFVHRALDLWLRPGATLSLVVNSYAASARGSARLVEHMRTKSSLEEVFELGTLPVFRGVSGRHMVFRLTKGKAKRANLGAARCGGVCRCSREGFPRRSLGRGVHENA